MSNLRIKTHAVVESPDREFVRIEACTVPAVQKRRNAEQNAALHRKERHDAGHAARGASGACGRKGGCALGVHFGHKAGVAVRLPQDTVRRVSRQLQKRGRSRRTASSRMITSPLTPFNDCERARAGRVGGRLLRLRPYGEQASARAPVRIGQICVKVSGIGMNVPLHGPESCQNQLRTSVLLPGKGSTVLKICQNMAHSSKRLPIVGVATNGRFSGNYC